MARKTKEEAELTRKKVIKSALLLFSEQGVAHTTLTDISKKAEVTKGAFYWHFKNKLEVFDAIIEEYSLPIEKQADDMMKQGGEPLQALLKTLHFFFNKVENSPELIALFDVTYYKCEYTHELAPKLKIEQEQLLNSKDDIASALANIDTKVWPDKTKQLVESTALAMIDILIGTLMRWIGSRQGSLTEQVQRSIEFVLKGAGINLPETNK